MLALALYAGLGALLGDWLIDDAGISFAYARNLAAGMGWVAQAGRTPVEGYSNFLWVLTLVPLFAAHLFIDPWTPKILAWVLMAGTLTRLTRALRSGPAAAWTAPVLCTLLATNAPIVIWTMSGLENGLLLFLFACFLEQVVRMPRHWRAKAGALAALMAMTRPDGVVFLGSGLVLSALAPDVSSSFVGIARQQAAYLGSFAALFAPFLGFRVWKFGKWLPQTYYAKREHLTFLERAQDLTANPAANWTKLVDFLRGTGGLLGPWLFAAAALALLVAAWRRTLTRTTLAALLFAVTALFAYLWLETDWMGEYRFGSVAIAACLLTAVSAGSDLLANVHSRRKLGLAAGALAMLIVIPGQALRVYQFGANPPTPLADVRRRSADRFDAYARLLGVTQGSLLIADVGAPLLYSTLTIYDLAGLVEPEAIRTLKGDTVLWLRNHPAFYDWVFERIKPTFISTRAFWTLVAALEKDPRFYRDYVSIHSHADAYLRSTYQWTARSGDYVRRDALEAAPGGSEAALLRLKSGYQPAPRPDRWVERLFDKWSQAPNPAELRQRATALLLGNAGCDAGLCKPNPDRAATLLQQLAERAPDDLTVLSTWAQALEASGRDFEAYPIWQRVLKLATATHDNAAAAQARDRLDDGSQVALMNLGLQALYETQDLPQAIARFRQVLALNPEHYGAHVQLATALSRSGNDPPAAQAAWQEVLRRATAIGDQPTAEAARSFLKAP